MLRGSLALLNSAKAPHCRLFALLTPLNSTSPSFRTTERFVTEKSNRYELHRGYQLIGDDDIPCVMTEDSEEEEEDRSSEPDYTAHSGLWCNFVIAPIELQDIETRRKAKLAEEKSSTIPLDKDKIAQISAAMANIKLPTPPGWEGISDSKILEFVRDKM